MTLNYILEGKKAVPCKDLLKWGKWYQTSNRVVANTKVAKNITVSTVFLGVNYAVLSSPPLLFETMIFGGVKDGYQDRYSTWEEAERGHHKACEIAFSC